MNTKKCVIVPVYTNITLSLIHSIIRTTMKLNFPCHILDHVCDYAPLHYDQLQKCLLSLPHFLRLSCYYNIVYSYNVRTFSKTEFEIVAINQDEQVRGHDLCVFVVTVFRNIVRHSYMKVCIFTVMLSI